MTCHILGLGPSIADYKPDKSHITIGVNDIYRHHETDFLFVISRLSPPRAVFVENARPRILFSQMPQWRNHPRYHPLETRLWNGNRPNPLNETVFHSNNTPFVAASWAYRHGFTEIVLWGVDFTNHPFINGEQLDICKRDFSQLQNQFLEKGCSLYLGSPGSVLDLPLWK